MKKFDRSQRYETDLLLNQYLLFHYGSDSDLLPFPFGPKESLHFPVRCVAECLDVESLPKNAKALELGCAVGRSSFELSRFCEQVVAIDNSQTFIHAAKQIQQVGHLDYTINDEGDQRSIRTARLPEKIDPARVIFKCGDAMDFFNKPNVYDVVLAANLICRLQHPQEFLASLHHLICPGGQLIITSPYSWLEEFTPLDYWIRGNCLESMEEIFKNHFSLQRSFDLPFLMREHLRKYQWGVAQATVWHCNKRI